MTGFGFRPYRHSGFYEEGTQGGSFRRCVLKSGLVL